MIYSISKLCFETNPDPLLNCAFDIVKTKNIWSPFIRVRSSFFTINKRTPGNNWNRLLINVYYTTVVDNNAKSKQPQVPSLQVTL